MCFFREGKGGVTKKIWAWVIVALLTLTFHSLISHAADDYDTALDKAGIFQGKIIKIAKNVLVIETSDGEIMRVSLPGETGKRSADFRVEELVEITMTSEGILTSLTPVPGEGEP